jgi:hypothetical protein
MAGEPSHVKQLSLNHVCKIGLNVAGRRLPLITDGREGCGANFHKSHAPLVSTFYRYQFYQPEILSSSFAYTIILSALCHRIQKKDLLSVYFTGRQPPPYVSQRRSVLAAQLILREKSGA